MAQFLRPDSTVTATSFTNGFANIDESAASDADFAYGANNTAAVLEVGLSNPSGTPASGTTTVRYRVAKTNAGVLNGSGSTVTVTCSVRQGANVIATDTARTATGTWAEYSFTPDMSGVTDWSDLRLRFTTSQSGGTTANRRGGAVSWAELEAPDAQSAITGTMAATESGSDSFAGSGTVADPSITGTLAATESGADAASGSGSVAVSGTLGSTEAGSDSASASGSIAITGSLSASDSGSDNLSATGQVALSGNLAATEAGSDAASSSGSVGISGALAANDGGEDGFAGTGSVESDEVTGSLNATETGEDTASFSGMALLIGLLDVADEGEDGFSGTGQVDVEGWLEGEDGGPDAFATLTVTASRRTTFASRPMQVNHARPTQPATPRPANISRGTR